MPLECRPPGGILRFIASKGSERMTTHSLFETYARADISFEQGAGAWLMGSDGRRYLDFGSGIAVTLLGHAHPHLVATLREKADKVWHTSNLFRIPEQERLAERLTAATFADRVFFTNSGAEALEVAIKTARRAMYVAGKPERYRLVTMEGAFHGRTLGTIAAGGSPKYLEGFGPPLEGFDQVPFGDIEAVKAAIGPETAGVLVEPIQGESGVRPLPDGALRELRRICDDEGLLLVLDEVQTGMGRTGVLFAHERAGVTPDIMAIAKGIGGGFPLGACLATEAAAKGMQPGTHGSTYGGNALACAVGNAVLDVVLADGFLEEVRRKASLLAQRTAALVDEHPDVFELVRGEGLLVGLKCKAPVADVVKAARAAGVIGIPAGDNTLRLLPPLIVSDEELREGIARLDAAARVIEKARAEAGTGAGAAAS
jgi:acetylornithine/N-succinyldiaminopimelate aminotransferase